MIFSGAEIMFHVAREIPYTEGDEQQVERKRHIGNDIIVLVYREPGAPPFDPDVVKYVHFFEKKIVFLSLTSIHPPYTSLFLDHISIMCF
jgi:hypothetical protein